MAATPQKPVHWAPDVAISDFGSPCSEATSSDSIASTYSLEYINSQLVAHGFTHSPGLSFEGLSSSDTDQLARCLLAMLSQRVNDISRTENLSTSLRTLSYDHERLMEMHRSATETAANAEREMNVYKSQIATTSRTLAASESAYQQTSAELQRTRSSLIALRATYSAEIKKKEKEVERVIAKWSKLSDVQTKLSTSSSGLTCRCGNADVVTGSETLGKGKGYPEIALEQAESARASLADETIPPARHHSHSQLYSVSTPKELPKPPKISSAYPVTYWSDMQIVTVGLKNLGNTCYMNATIQCLSATVPFARFFTEGQWKKAVNAINPMGTKGHLASAFAHILYEMSHSELPHLIPATFRKSICTHAPQFSGPDQHDSQKFLTFLLDGLHEDLNRVLHKPSNGTTPEREAELERLPQAIASAQEWEIYRTRNDSLIVDFFQGQFKNRLVCLTCRKTLTTYDSFMYLSLPMPSVEGPSKTSLQSCLDAFVKEVLSGTEAWHCPHCKTLRNATKQLSLSRLPPILLIHLKRFSHKGVSTDKIETVVDFPLKSLDLTNYMPPALPPGIRNSVNSMNGIGSDDPRVQTPPYRYDLYGVTNHFGNPSNGHYNAFIASRGGWVYCDDSRITPTDARDIVGRPAYVLYYKRIQS